MKNWLLRHAQVVFGVAGQLIRAPVTTALTLLVIGITLALPTTLFVVVENVQRVAKGLDTGGKISLFLKNDVSDKQARLLIDRIKKLDAVERVEFISRSAALEEFRRHSGLGPAVDVLEENPLPTTLVVSPAARSSISQVNRLRLDLLEMPGVEAAVQDTEWVRRLFAILAVAERGSYLLAGFLSIAVLLIIGNTIRLAVANRTTEIEVIQLVGGTSAFIRRPFLYSGLIQGMVGGLTAWIVVEMAVFGLSGPAEDLARLYGSSFSLHGLGPAAVLVLVAGGGFLGWLGSRIAVGWHLARFSDSR